MVCKNCNTVNADDVMFCTSCGAQLSGYQGEVVATTSDVPAKGLGIASMILGIVSLVACNIAGIPSIVGLILAIVAKKKGNTSGMATAGFVMSLIAIILSVLALIGSIIYYFVFFLALMGGSAY